MRKICVVTGSRAEYGLLYWLMRSIQKKNNLKLQLIVTGSHLSPEFGLTYKQIKKDGFEINKKIEILLSSDSSVGIAKSMGVATLGFAEAFSELKPNIIVLLGDRYEILSAASTALVAQIPIAHIHGGEVTEGAFDDAIRHSITKMSHLHLVSTEKYKNRVIQLGEQPSCVHNVGALGVDNIKRMTLLSRKNFEKAINFTLSKKNLLVTFHPCTLDKVSSKKQFFDLLRALEELTETHLIFTKANADSGGRVINKMIDSYVEKNPYKSVAFTSLGQLRYLSALKYIDAVVGNSSSGIIEAPSFHIGTVNVGDRQRGRIFADSVIDCGSDYLSIASALELLYCKRFCTALKFVKNPYEGKGETAKEITNLLSSFCLENSVKKQFYDLA